MVTILCHILSGEYRISYIPDVIGDPTVLQIIATPFISGDYVTLFEDHLSRHIHKALSQGVRLELKYFVRELHDG